MRKLLVIIILLFSQLANATDWNAYHEQDRFEWTNYDNGVHILASYALTTTGGLLLNKKLGLPIWESALIAAMAATLVGVTKEAMFDAYASKTDMKCWAAGAIAGGLILVTFRF